MTSYCNWIGSHVRHVRFVIDDERIEPHDTAEMLALENDDIVDATVVDEVAVGFKRPFDATCDTAASLSEAG